LYWCCGKPYTGHVHDNDDALFLGCAAGSFSDCATVGPFSSGGMQVGSRKRNGGRVCGQGWSPDDRKADLMNDRFFSSIPQFRSDLKRKLLLCGCLWSLVLAAEPVDRRVVGRDADSSSVEWIERLTNGISGDVTVRKHGYIEVGTGLNYRDESGQWRESRDLIELTDDGGAAALQGSHKVHFQPNLNTPGVISITTVSNRVLRTHILGLYYFDAATGQSALIGAVQDSIGELFPPNQIIYHDAFDGIKADVRYTFTRAGFESDVILRERPLPPQVFGLNPANSRLEIWHEFLNPPRLQKQVRVLKQQSDATLRQSMVEPDLTDETLDFGDLWFPLGRAYAWDTVSNTRTNVPAQIQRIGPGSHTDALLVAKQLLVLEKRNVLIETVDWRDIEPKMESLSRPGRVASASRLKSRWATGRQLPSRRVAGGKPPSREIKVASVPYTPPGFVIDYVAYNLSHPPAFESGVTYYVSGAVYTGDVLTFESGCILKFASGTYLLTHGGGVICNGTTSSPSIFTSRDDDLYGEPIVESTGHPVYAANPVLWLYYLASGARVNGAKIRWANTAVRFDPVNDGSSHTFQNSALEQSGTGLHATGSTVSIINSTQCGVQTPVSSGQPYGFFTSSLTVNCNGDADSDGLPDNWEDRYFGNITSQNGTGDADGDGLTDRQEYLGRGNPASPDILKVWIAEPKANSNIP
jgi:hypothetical protein